jgi:hypothetical protein
MARIQPLSRYCWLVAGVIVLLGFAAAPAAATAAGPSGTDTPAPASTPTSTPASDTPETPETDSPDDTAPPGNATENDTLAAELTLSELQRGGEQFPGDDPSLRVTDERPFSVVHWPADRAFSSPGNDDNWRWLRPGGLVDRNAIWLRHFSTEGSEPLTLHIAYYEIGEQRRSIGDGETTTEQVATNVTVDSVSLEFDRGFPAWQEIELRQSDEPRQVAMWIDGTDARWTFEHHSVATTQELPFSSWGGFMQWAAVIWVLPLVGGLAGANYTAKRAIERMGVFTQWGYAPWLALFGLVVAGLGLFASTWSARIFVEYPFIVPAVIVGFTLLLILETLTDGVRRVRFVRDNIENRKSPSGDHAVEATMQDEVELTLIDRPDQPIRAASPGLRPALSRLVGGAAPVKAVHPGAEADEMGEVRLRDAPLQTTKSVEDGHVDEEVYVHPDSPRIVDYTPEGWTFAPPTPSSRGGVVRWLLGAGLIAALAALMFNAVGPNAAIVTAGLAVGAAGVEPQSGRLLVWPANYHYRSARASSKYLAEETDKYETIEQERAEKEKAKIERQKQIKSAVDARDSTLIENMFTDPSAAVSVEEMVDPMHEAETPAERYDREERRNGGPSMPSNETTDSATDPDHSGGDA